MPRMKSFTWLLALTIAPPALAAEYPDRPIRIVVPFTAGSGTDLLARLIGPHLTQAWGQQVIIENRTGAGGTIGTAIVATATPDGHTLLMNSSAFAGAPSIYPKLPFDTIKDFTGVSLVAGNPLVLSVAPSVGVKAVKELIALAHKHPGKYTFGSAGVGTGSHYGAELFRFMAKMDTVHVPYRGTPESIMDTVANRITYSTPPILAVLPLVRFDLSLRSWFFAQAALAGLGTRSTVESQVGSAQVAQAYGLLGGSFRFRAGARLRPFATLSAGVLRTSVEGRADPPNHGRVVDQWSFLVDAGFGASLRLPDRFTLSLAAHAQLPQSMRGFVARGLERHPLHDLTE